MYDDVIYCASLFICIVFGLFYRRIDKIELKKWIGDIAGLLLVFLLSGYHAVHLFIVFAGNFYIISSKKRRCHLKSFLFSFIYLLFFRSVEYFHIPYPSGHMNLIQMMFVLKMVGLAYEMQNRYENLDTLILYDNLTKETKTKLFYNIIDPSMSDIFHYSFNYLGIIAGPYFKYATFRDYFELPFSKKVNGEVYAINRLKILPLPICIYIITSYFWPVSYIISNDFYANSSFLYRLWYIWAIFFLYRMRLYCGLILAECICLTAGFGAYPDFTNPRPGIGPTGNFEVINEISEKETSSTMPNFNYSFDAVKNVDPYMVDFCVTFRGAIRHWNACIQYWMVVNVYKRVPFKNLRTAVTLFVSAYWHGIYFGHYVCIWSVALYLPVEDLYIALFFKKKGRYNRLWEWILWFMKMQTFAYLCIAMQLLTYKQVLKYYESVYHFWPITLIVFYTLGYFIKLSRSVKLFSNK